MSSFKGRRFHGYGRQTLTESSVVGGLCCFEIILAISYFILVCIWVVAVLFIIVGSFGANVLLRLRNVVWMDVGRLFCRCDLLPILDAQRLGEVGRLGAGEAGACR